MYIDQYKGLGISQNVVPFLHAISTEKQTGMEPLRVVFNLANPNRLVSLPYVYSMQSCFLQV